MINYLGSGQGVDSCILPSHQAGDFLLCYAFSTNLDDPTIPSGWTLIGDIGRPTGSRADGIVAYKVADSNGEVSGTWINSTSLDISVWRNTTGSISVGTTSFRWFDFTPDFVWDAATLSVIDGTSTVVAISGNVNYTATAAANPNGSAMVSSRGVFGEGSVSIYELSGATTWPEATASTGASSNAANTGMIELVAVSPALVITDTTDPLVSGGVSTTSLSGAGASQLAGKIEQGIGATSIELSVISWIDTEIQATSIDIESTSLKYGAHFIRVTADSGDEGSVFTEVIPHLNNAVVNIASLVDTSFRLEPLAVGSQVRYQNLAYKDGVMTDVLVTVNNDGSYSLDGAAPNGTYTFEVNIWDSTDSTWGTPAIQTIVIGEVTSTSDIVMTNTDVPDGVHSFKLYNDSTNTLIEVKDITFSGGSATTTVEVTLGTPFLAYKKGSNPPTTGMAYDGVTQ